MKTLYHILILEDELLVAQNIETIIRQFGEFKTSKSYQLDDAINIISNEKVDLIISDINLNGKYTGIEILEKIQKKYWIPVIYITAYSDNNVIDSALKTSPVSFLTKPFTAKQLEVAITIAKKISPNTKDEFSIHAPTERELEIITLLSNGHNSKSIAEMLFLSEHTIKTHRKNILKKFNLKSTSELINFAHKLNWIKYEI